MARRWSVLGYAQGKCLHSSSISEVYAGTRESDGREVVLKAYVEDSTDDRRSRTQREFEALRKVAGASIPEALELVRGAGESVLVLARVSGVPLSQLAAGAPLESGAFLAVAIALAEALARVHDARLLHRDISPQNVLVDPASFASWLIDFGLAQPLGRAAAGVQAASELQRESQGLVGTLRYVSPEQTGRMDRGIDSRSDLYGLGATLYFALTGQPPFDSDDPLALIHAHMAKPPPSPVALRPELPATLSRIVMKLLQKSPEARYQTARALHRDLCECWAQLQRDGSIEDDYPLAVADAPYRPLFSQRLYGRDREVATLLEAYGCAAAGHPRVLLLHGAPGVGKSALIQELRAPLAQRGGYLASGKFDLYRRDLPYLGFIQAFESLAQQILTESDAALAKWRRELRESLGPSAAVMAELVSDLRFVLGDVPAVATLGPAETRARLSLAVQRFIHAFATREHPLVLFLDDLQWADAGSRDLLAALLPALRDQALLLLGAYRDTEVDATHPLRLLLLELDGQDPAPERISLVPLSEEACAQMLADALGRTEEDTRSLAACVRRKTENTPLLIQQFVYHMYDLGLIRFELPVGWTWDDLSLAAADIPDDAAGLMTAKIGRLEPQVAAVLQLASCVGSGFCLDALTELTELSRNALEQSLFSLCDEGLIAPAPGGFRFVHDRIREAAQALLSPEERARVHGMAARLLLESTPDEALPDRAAEIADHINLADSPLGEAERLRAIEVNLLAGNRALGAGAAATAAHYMGAGRALFRHSYWTTHPQLGFELFFQAAESAYQMREADLALEIIAVLEAHPWPRLLAAQISAKAIMAQLLVCTGRETLPFVLEKLRAFGVRWPAYPSRLRTHLAILRTQWALRGPLDENLFRPAGARDQSSWLAPSLIMVAGAAPMTWTTVRLVCLMTSYLLNAYRRHGYVLSPALSLAGFAAYRLGVLQHLRGAERYAKAALEWSARVPHPIYSARTEFVVHAFIYSWTRTRRSILEPLRWAETQSREAGDLEFAFYAAVQRAHQASLAGEQLARVATEYVAIAAQRLPESVWPDIQPRILALLQGRPLDPSVLTREIREIETLLGSSESARMSRWVFWLEVLCLLGRYTEAFATSEQIATWISHVGSSSSQVADFHLFRGIVAAERASERGSGTRRRHVRVLRECQKRLRIWARHGPDFVHMVEVLQAERERLRRRSHQALADYARASELATQQQYVHHAAFAHERRAHLLLSLRRPTEAAAALRQASALYDEWGAHAKATALRAQADEQWSR